METIAYKSIYNQRTHYFFSGICAITSIYFFFEKSYTWAIFLFAVFVFSIFTAIYCSRQPDELIKLNNDTLEIYYSRKVKYIPLTDILKVNFYTINLTFTLTYGHLNLTTKKGRVIVFNISDINNVAMKISELKAVANQNKPADNFDI